MMRKDGADAVDATTVCSRDEAMVYRVIGVESE